MKIAIIGGGAAGFIAGISAAAKNSRARITLFEATRKPLDKVRISGGGRCNVTHNCFDPLELVKNYPRGAKELLGPFSRFQPREIIAWFEAHGVLLKTESDGRMFPVTDKSETVVNCLLDAARESGVEVRLGARVKNIESCSENSKSPEFEIKLSDGARQKFDRVLLATGNSPQGYRFSAALKHEIVSCVPSLFTFKINDARLKGLAGVSFENATLTLENSSKRKLEQSGPLLITHWGLSGPAALKLSAWGARELHEYNYHCKLKINFLPGYNSNQIYSAIAEYKMQNGRKRIHSASPVVLPRRYWGQIAGVSGVSETDTWSGISRATMNKIVSELSGAVFMICGKGIFKEEFVTCGGVKLSEVDFKTMQSKRCPGLYFAGELLDIDGVTGGFNFQSAWTTGWIAGERMVE
ncbi:MAG: NAD(P)/FAD-dependent oxidoreductase [candidate division Zixibacteria bacterium]|nr:NAD(P)/FAD-dependent oxidoreductase [candidate division Zixibacteria bacterium]